MSKKLNLTISTELIDIDEESIKTPDIMRRSDQVNFPSPLNSPTSIKHRESTVRVEVEDLRRGLYKKKKIEDDKRKKYIEDNNNLELS